MRMIGMLSLALAGLSALAQQPTAGTPATRGSARTPPTPSTASRPASVTPATQPSAASSAAVVQPDYILGAGDQILVRVLHAEEFTGDRPMQVDMSGFVRLPLVGRVKAGGRTVSEVEAEIAEKLKNHLLKPDVSIAIAEFRSQPVSIFGSVRLPGVQQVQGRKTLIEALSLAGGPEPTAGPVLKITRKLEYGKLPLEGAVVDEENQVSTAEVSLRAILEAQNPNYNIAIQPYDVITVPKAKMIHVMGKVTHQGSYALTDQENVSVLQAVSMAGGLDLTAKPKDSIILRETTKGGERQEIPVDVQKIMQAKSADVQMQAEDILVIPDNVPKKAFLRGLEAAIQTGTGIAVFRR